MYAVRRCGCDWCHKKLNGRELGRREMGLPSRQRKRIIVVRKRDAKKHGGSWAYRMKERSKAKWWNIDE